MQIEGQEIKIRAYREEGGTLYRCVQCGAEVQRFIENATKEIKRIPDCPVQYCPCCGKYLGRE